MNHYAEGYEVPPHSRMDFRLLAKAVRKEFGIPEADPFPVVRFLEFALPELYDDFQYQVMEQHIMGENHGMTYPDQHRILIREDVYEGAVAGKGRDRFTVAHEISHQLVHEGIPLTMARRDAGKLELFRNSEWQADCMAGELLMPFSELKTMTIGRIMGAYKVSSAAAETQLKAALGRRRCA